MWYEHGTFLWCYSPIIGQRSSLSGFEFLQKTLQIFAVMNFWVVTAQSDQGLTGPQPQAELLSYHTQDAKGKHLAQVPASQENL